MILKMKNILIRYLLKELMDASSFLYMDQIGADLAVVTSVHAHSAYDPSLGKEILFLQKLIF